MKKKRLEEIIARIKAVKYPPIDAVIGIARGGIVPAYLIASHLNIKDIDFVWIKHRDNSNNIITKPFIYRMPCIDIKGKNVLIVDDRVKSGESMKLAIDTIKKLEGKPISLAVNGKADISLYDEECFLFPWNL